MKVKKVSAVWALASTAFLHTACTPTTIALQPVSSGSRVQIISLEPGKVRQDVDGAESVAKGAGTGALTGAGGGIYIAEACGPLILFCAPAFAVVGAGVGLVGGTIYGAIIALPEEKETEFNRMMATRFSQTSPQRSLEQAFEKHGERIWEIVEASPDAIVKLKLDSFQMKQYSSSELAIHLQASFAASYPSHSEKETRYFQFNYMGLRHPVDYYLEDEGRYFREEFDRGIASLATQMATSLRWKMNASPIARSPTGTIEFY